jgi:hypothetical protein
VQQASAGRQLGLSYAAVVSSATCPLYGANREGTALSVVLYDFGTEGFTPAEFVVNSTSYSGTFSAIGPGSLQAYTLTLAGCAHGSGLVIAVIDSLGDEGQFES